MRLPATSGSTEYTVYHNHNNVENYEQVKAISFCGLSQLIIPLNDHTLVCVHAAPAVLLPLLSFTNYKEKGKNSVVNSNPFYLIPPLIFSKLKMN